MIFSFSAADKDKSSDAPHNDREEIHKTFREGLVEIKDVDNGLWIDFPFARDRKSPRLKAIYEAGIPQPEIYLNVADPFVFEARKKEVFNFIPSNSLIQEIGRELKKALSDFLRAQNIPDNLFKYFITKKTDNSVIRYDERNRQLMINIQKDGFHIEYTLGPDINCSITVSAGDTSPSITRRLDFKQDNTLEDVSDHCIKYLQNAIRTMTEVHRRMGQNFSSDNGKPFEYSHGSAKFCVKPDADFSNILVSVDGILRGSLSIEAFDIDEFLSIVYSYLDN